MAAMVRVCLSVLLVSMLTLVVQCFTILKPGKFLFSISACLFFLLWNFFWIIDSYIDLANFNNLHYCYLLSRKGIALIYVNATSSSFSWNMHLFDDFIFNPKCCYFVLSMSVIEFYSFQIKMVVVAMVMSLGSLLIEWRWMTSSRRTKQTSVM